MKKEFRIKVWFDAATYEITEVENYGSKYHYLSDSWVRWKKDLQGREYLRKGKQQIQIYVDETDLKEEDEH